jgi:hypothetical protein
MGFHIPGESHASPYLAWRATQHYRRLIALLYSPHLVKEKFCEIVLVGYRTGLLASGTD